jgi:hypothetical protein
MLHATTVVATDRENPPPLGVGDDLQRLSGFQVVGEDLYHLLPVGTDPAPVAHQTHGPEQIPQGMRRINPMQHKLASAQGSAIWSDLNSSLQVMLRPRLFLHMAYSMEVSFAVP